MNSFSGKGSRKPQLDIDINLIDADYNNPRLVPYLSNPKDASQFDLISVLFENFDTEVVAMSLVENGYFYEEPIIVIPNNLPEDFSFNDYNGQPDKLGEEIQKLIDARKTNFTVLEGNRRASAIKLI